MSRLLLLMGSLLFSWDLMAAQIYLSQDSVNIRTVHRWDQSSGLEVNLGSKGRVQHTARISSFPFRLAESCKGLSYRMRGENFFDEVSLDHLCPSLRDQSVKFLLISDTQAMHRAHEKVAHFLSSLMENDDYAFVVNGGDIVNYGTEKEWKRYYQISSKYLANTPVLPILGNHEFYNDKEIKLYREVYGSNNNTAYFSFKLKKNLFIALDSNTEIRSAAYMKQQLAWLESELKEYAGEYNIIVAYHHPAYTSGLSSFVMPKEPAYIRDNWLPLFEKYGVDLILNGHDHIYERLEYDSGIPAIISGAAGGYLGAPGKIHEFSKIREIGKRTVTSIEISSDDIHIKTYDAFSGKILDEEGYSPRSKS